MRWYTCLAILGLSACGGSDTASGSVPDTSPTQQPGNGSGAPNGTTPGHSSAGTGGSQSDAGTTPPSGQGDAATQPQTSNSNTAQSLIWVWTDYASSLATVAANPKSFTHVSPALYQINYNYTGGLPQWWQEATDSFDGLTSAQIASTVHAAGMKVVPLVFGGGGNNGTDQGIENILADSPAGTQSSFITSMVNEAVAKGYDGYNLDWEVSGAMTNAQYGAELESFLAAFKTALHAHGMQLSFDLGTWYIQQTFCSGGTGVVDLTQIGPNVDLAILEDYSTTMGTASASCPASLPNPQTCGSDFMSALNLMCVYVPNANISIGFNANAGSGNNVIAGSSIAAVEQYGIHNVALWPDYNADGPSGSYVLADANAIQPSGSSWFSLLAAFLAH